MSDRPEAIVVGGGLIGLLTAYEFDRRGWRTRVFESGQPARQASWAGGGILSPLRPWNETPFVQSLTVESQGRTKQLLDEFEAVGAVEWQQTGMYVRDPEPSAAAWATSHAPDAEFSEAGLLLPSVAQLRTPRFGRFAIDICRQVGVNIFSDRPVTHVRPAAGGQLEVAWSQGRTQADVVCICAGAWSSQIDIEGYPPVEHARVEPVRGQMIAYSPVKSPPARIELSGGTYLIPRKDRRVLVGSTLEHVGFDNATTEQAKNALRAAAETLAPTLKDGNIEHHWAGLRPKVVQSPDPVIGPSPSVPGLWFNTGHFRNGVTLAAGSAVRLASQVAAS